jgi:uncharacterized membrane protein
MLLIAMEMKNGNGLSEITPRLAGSITLREALSPRSKRGLIITFVVLWLMSGTFLFVKHKALLAFILDAPINAAFWTAVIYAIDVARERLKVKS